MVESLPNVSGAETNARADPVAGQEVWVTGIPCVLLPGVTLPPFVLVVAPGVTPLCVVVPCGLLPVPGAWPPNRLCPKGVTTRANTRLASNTSNIARITTGRRLERLAGGCTGTPCAYLPGGVIVVGMLSFGAWYGTPGCEIGWIVPRWYSWGLLTTVSIFASSTALCMTGCI